MLVYRKKREKMTTIRTKFAGNLVLTPFVVKRCLITAIFYVNIFKKKLILLLIYRGKNVGTQTDSKFIVIFRFFLTIHG